MKKPTLYFIYGAPSSGKLTTAKMLAKETGISLFHNHLTFDVAASIYEVWSDKFTKYCEDLRLDGIARAMKENKDLIFTFCYVLPDDNKFVLDVLNIIEEYNANIEFIQLEVSRDTLNNRVENKERGNYEKINCKNKLNTFLDKNDSFSAIPFKDSFIVNTDKNIPKESVKKIQEYFNN